MRRRTERLEARFYPAYKSEDDVFREMLERCPVEGKVVLDAGCGSGRFEHDLKSRARTVIGIDLTPDIADNKWVAHRLLGSLYQLPLADESVSFVVCKYVLEHLQEPEAAFAEVARVLEPGGYFLIHTPNRFHYVPVIASLLPHSMHEKINAARGRAQSDTFPTVYRANSLRRIRRLARDAGLEVVELRTLESKPNYLVFSRLAYLVGVAYERIVNRFNILSPLRVNIFGLLRKAEPGKESR